MTLRRYLLVRTGWAAGMLFAFVSIAYLVVWVAGNYRGDSGYGSFLWGALTGSLGELPARPPSERVSVSSLVWHASGVTLSLLLFTAAFTAVVACLLALVARGRRPALAAVRGFEFLGASLLPVWTGLYIAFYLGYKAGLLHTAGYCPLLSAPAGHCHGPVEWAAHLVWPAVTLTIFFAALYSRMLRHDLAQAERERRGSVEAGEEPKLVRRYYRGIYAKRAARDLGFALGFAMFVEVTFGLPGLGQTMVIAVNNEEGVVAAGVLVCASVIAVAASLLVDVVCALAEPRFRRF